MPAPIARAFVLSASMLLPVLSGAATASSPFPPTPYAPPQAISRLAGPYVLWTVIDRDGKPVRIECAVRLTDGDVPWARTDNRPGPGTSADPFYLAETDGGYACTGRVLDPHGIANTITGAWSIGDGGAIRFLQAKDAPLVFRPGMIPGEYALPGGKVYLAALQVPSTLGAGMETPLGGPGVGYVATAPDGWTAAVDPEVASITLASPGRVLEPDVSLSSLPAGAAACTVRRIPAGRGYGVEPQTQDELNKLAREAASRDKMGSTHIPAARLSSGARPSSADPSLPFREPGPATTRTRWSCSNSNGRRPRSRSKLAAPPVRPQMRRSRSRYPASSPH
jgi:hypothetical protein